jgi:hypothetical protein
MKVIVEINEIENRKALEKSQGNQKTGFLKRKILGRLIKKREDKWKRRAGVMAQAVFKPQG